MIQIDEQCREFPESLRAWTYDAVLEDHGYISIRVLGRGFTEPTVVGQLYPQSYPQSGSQFRLVVNFNYDELDDYPQSPALVLYGTGDLTASGSTIEGAIVASAGLTGRVPAPRCPGAHRFTFVR